MDHLANDTSLWGVMLEKVWAKTIGNYDLIFGGAATDTYDAILGAPGTYTYFTSATTA